MIFYDFSTNGLTLTLAMTGLCNMAAYAMRRIGADMRQQMLPTEEAFAYVVCCGAIAIFYVGHSHRV